MNTQDILDRGLARLHNGRLIPVMRGGDPAADSPFPAVPEDLAAIGDDELQAFIDSGVAAVEAVHAAPADFVNEARTSADLVAEMTATVEAVEAARAEQTSRAEAAAAAEPEPDPEPEPEPAETAALDEADLAAVSELASRAQREEPEPDPEPEPAPEPEPEPEPEAALAEPVVAAAPPARRTPPARARRAEPQPAAETVALVAAAGADLPLGTEFETEEDIAAAMIRRRTQFGHIGEDVSGEKMTIARADWSRLYPPERVLGGDPITNQALIAAALDPDAIKAEMRRRRSAQDRGDALVAAGGLCAPVTPYYQLQMLSVSDRPVRAALASFNADRGGIRYARPAALTAIDTGIGQISAADDALGGTFATKTCQVIDCPPFEETAVETLFHCLQFGNLGARTFPELVAQWNQLVLASQARQADSFLLTEIDAASTQVTAASLGLGAVGALAGQILAAANGMRSRHRMDSDAVLRLLIPAWAVDLLVSDVIRSQFARFDTDAARITALFRSFNVEPTFYLDGAAGRGQVFGAQADGALLPFPETVTWYLYPEGSFLHLDGGSLELGLVRDSVLNSTNDFQIFGESFEHVAFVGVEALAVESTVCDSGTVSLPAAIDCPVNYTHAS